MLLLSLYVHKQSCMTVLMLKVLTCLQPPVLLRCFWAVVSLSLLFCRKKWETTFPPRLTYPLIFLSTSPMPPVAKGNFSAPSCELFIMNLSWAKVLFILAQVLCIHSRFFFFSRQDIKKIDSWLVHCPDSLAVFELLCVCADQIFHYSASTPACNRVDQIHVQIVLDS